MTVGASRKGTAKAARPAFECDACGFQPPKWLGRCSECGEWGSIGGQVWIQLQGVFWTILVSGIVAFIAYKIVDLTIGLRVSEEEEREGLDITSHGETAYSK